MGEQPAGSATRNLGSRESRPVLADWWTDHQGRKQVLLRRVSGDVPPWNPLGRIHPGVLFRAEADRWLAVCRCGEAGPPERLAWMGPCFASTIPWRLR